MYTYRIESVKDGKLKFLTKVNISELADPTRKLKSTLRKHGYTFKRNHTHVVDNGGVLEVYTSVKGTLIATMTPCM
jgi:hypothetical protein